MIKCTGPCKLYYHASCAQKRDIIVKGSIQPQDSKGSGGDQNSGEEKKSNEQKQIESSEKVILTGIEA